MILLEIHFVNFVLENELRVTFYVYVMSNIDVKVGIFKVVNKIRWHLLF